MILYMTGLEMIFTFWFILFYLVTPLKKKNNNNEPVLLL